MRRDFIAAAVVIGVSAITFGNYDPSILRQATAQLRNTAAAASAQTALDAGPRAPIRQAAATLQISGGFIGLDRRIELRTDGTITAIDARPKQTRGSKLSAGEFTALQALLANVTPAVSQSPQCRDCITYELTITRAGSPVTVRGDDIALARSNAADVIRKLEQILSRVLQGEQQ